MKPRCGEDGASAGISQTATTPSGNLVGNSDETGGKKPRRLSLYCFWLLRRRRVMPPKPRSPALNKTKTPSSGTVVSLSHFFGWLSLLLQPCALGSACVVKGASRVKPRTIASAAFFTGTISWRLGSTGTLGREQVRDQSDDRHSCANVKIPNKIAAMCGFGRGTEVIRPCTIGAIIFLRRSTKKRSALYRTQESRFPHVVQPGL